MPSTQRLTTTYLQRYHSDPASCSASCSAQKHLRLLCRRLSFLVLGSFRRTPAFCVSIRLPRSLPLACPPTAAAYANPCHSVNLRRKVCLGLSELQAGRAGFFLSFEDGRCPVVSKKDGEGARFPIEFSTTPHCLCIGWYVRLPFRAVEFEVEPTLSTKIERNGLEHVHNKHDLTKPTPRLK